MKEGKRRWLERKERWEMEGGEKVGEEGRKRDLKQEEYKEHGVN